MSNTAAVRIGDAARELGITEDHLRDLCDGGRIPHSRTPGGHRLFDPRVLRAIREEGLDAYEHRQRHAVATVPDLEGRFPAIELAPSVRYMERSVESSYASPFVVLDTGRTTQVSWSTAVGPKLPLLPAGEGFELTATSTERIRIKSITLVVDPLVYPADLDPSERELLRKSYVMCFGALLAGQLVLSYERKPVVIPVSRLRVLSPMGSSADVLSQQVDLDPGELPDEAQVVIPPFGHCQIHLCCPTRPVADAVYIGFVLAWSGIVQLAYERIVGIGSVDLPVMTPANWPAPARAPVGMSGPPWPVAPTPPQ